MNVDLRAQRQRWYNLIRTTIVRGLVHRAWANRACFLVAILMLSGCISALASSTLPVGEAAPELALEASEQTVSLAGLRGRVVLLNFWSSG
jgi:hypothetical protein